MAVPGLYISWTQLSIFSRLKAKVVKTEKYKNIYHTYYTVVVAYINTMKTTFDLNIKFILSIDTRKHGIKEKLSI